MSYRRWLAGVMEKWRKSLKLSPADGLVALEAEELRDRRVVVAQVTEVAARDANEHRGPSGGATARGGGSLRGMGRRREGSADVYKSQTWVVSGRRPVSRLVRVGEHTACCT